MLTDSKIKALKPRDKPYKTADGGGLYLLVPPTGGKLWRLKYRLDGRENVVSFGQYPDVGLAAARIKAGEARVLIATGIHPLAHKKAADAAKKAEQVNSFAAVTQAWIEANAKHWRPYTLSQVRATMGRYVIDNTAVGALPIRKVQTTDIRALLQSVAQRTVLRPGERKASAVTVARNLRMWCRAVFEYAVERDLAETDPTYPLRNLTELKRPASSIKHNKKMTPSELRRFLDVLSAAKCTRQTAIAIELLLLFFVRTGELRQARWDEFDFKLLQWRIPASRMKAGREHMVPISKQALKLLLEQQQISGTNAWVFPNQRNPGESMSATTINRALERMGLNGEGTMGLAAHGFRGTASTHLHELGFNSDVVEKQLAHVPRNKVKAIYSSAQYVPERTEMMQKWADYLDLVKTAKPSDSNPPAVAA